MTFSQSYLYNKPFIKHLASQRLFDEQLYFLSHIADSLDAGIQMEKGWVYQAKGDNLRALKYYRTVPVKTLMESSFKTDYIRLLISADDLLLAEKLIPGLTDTAVRNRMQLSVRLLQRTQPLNAYLPDYLYKPYKNYCKINKKHVGIAAGLSILIPGTGKVYIGKVRQGLNMLLINLVFAGQAAESYIRAGPESFRFIAFTTLFSLFYSGNIYGTIKGFKKAKTDARSRMLYEIENYYLSDYTVYPD